MFAAGRVPPPSSPFSYYEAHPVTSDNKTKLIRVLPLRPLCHIPITIWFRRATVFVDTSVLAVSVSLKLGLLRVKPCPPSLDNPSFEARVAGIVNDAGFEVVDESMVEVQEVN